MDASADDAAAAQKHKPLMINRLYTGLHRQTHVEEIEAKFVSGGEVDGYKLLANAGAELRRAPPQRPRRAGDFRRKKDPGMFRWMASRLLTSQPSA